MTPRQTRRLLYVGLLIIATAASVGLVLYALRQNIHIFYTPTQIQMDNVPKNHYIRVGGMIEKGSLKRGDNLSISFSITDFNHNLTIQYQGILPDLFREGQGVVAAGTLIDHNTFLAEEVLAKHDENYMPPEVSRSIQQSKR